MLAGSLTGCSLVLSDKSDASVSVDANSIWQPWRFTREALLDVPIVAQLPTEIDTDSDSIAALPDEGDTLFAVLALDAIVLDQNADLPEPGVFCGSANFGEHRLI